MPRSAACRANRGIACLIAVSSVWTSGLARHAPVSSICGRASRHGKARDRHLARSRRDRRAVLRRHLAGCRSCRPGSGSQSRVAPRAIAGLGFAATCSLVVVDQREAAAGRPVRGSRAQHHRLDGPPGTRSGASYQPDPGKGPAICRRCDFSRDGDPRSYGSRSTGPQSLPQPDSSSICPII